MVDLARDEPRYGWAGNKGYAAAEHRAALLEFGPSPWHRVSWNIHGVVPDRDGPLPGQDVLVTDADLVAP
jgi:ribonuclease HII